MPIIDILGGVFGSSGSGSGGSSGSGSGSSSGSTSTTASGVSSLANLVFPGIGSFLSNLWGNLQCLGGQAMTKETYNEWLGYAVAVVEGVTSNKPISWVQAEINQWAYQINMWETVDLRKLVNPCSKQICQKCIKLLRDTRDRIFEVYETTSAHNVTINGMTVLTRTLISRKPGSIIYPPSQDGSTTPVVVPPTTPPVVVTPPSYPPVTYPPTTPPVVTPPVTYPPVLYPDTTTPPIYNPPVTYPDTTTPPIYNPQVTYPDTTVYPPVTATTGNTTNSTVGMTRTQTTHPDGSITIYIWNSDGTLYRTINRPAPKGGGGSMASSLDGNIDISGNVGDWNFGLNNNKDQTLYIAGGLGLLGLIAYMAKSKK